MSMGQAVLQVLESHEFTTKMLTLINQTSGAQWTISKTNNNITKKYLNQNLNLNLEDFKTQKNKY